MSNEEFASAMDTITGKDVQFSFIGLTNKAKSYIGFD
jgi:hypothetical protein